MPLFFEKALKLKLIHMFNKQNYLKVMVVCSFPVQINFYFLSEQFHCTFCVCFHSFPWNFNVFYSSKVCHMRKDAAVAAKTTKKH